MLFIALLTRNASAQSSGSNYDWRSGNSYTWNKGPDGTTNLQGFNLRSGTHWNTTIQPNGNMHGFDGGNHYWTYQQGSGYYHNFGTGDTCIGQGYARHCY
jgi:hypothetical protein